MPRAIWRGTVVAEADRVEMVKGGSACFPSEALCRVSSSGDMVSLRPGVEAAP
jgi:hypothetical protein